MTTPVLRYGIDAIPTPTTSTPTEPHPMSDHYDHAATLAAIQDAHRKNQPPRMGRLDGREVDLNTLSDDDLCRAVAQAEAPKPTARPPVPGARADGTFAQDPPRGEPDELAAAERSRAANVAAGRRRP